MWRSPFGEAMDLMKRCLFALVIVLLLGPGASAQEVCQVAVPEHVSYCEHDQTGMCCVIDSGPGCYEVTCYSFDYCAWDQGFRLCF